MDTLNGNRVAILLILFTYLNYMKKWKQVLHLIDHKKLKILHMLMKWKCHETAGDSKCQGAYVTLLPLNDEHITWLQINTSSLASRILHDHRAWRSDGFIMTDRKLGHLRARGMKWWRHGMLQDSQISGQIDSHISCCYMPLLVYDLGTQTWWCQEMQTLSVLLATVQRTTHHWWIPITKYH